jgi:hypothetical protein
VWFLILLRLTGDAFLTVPSRHIGSGCETDFGWGQQGPDQQQQRLLVIEALQENLRGEMKR